MKRLTLICIAIISALTSFAKPPVSQRINELTDVLMHTLDSAEIYSARKEQEIQMIKDGISKKNICESYLKIAEGYSKFIADSSIVYYDKARKQAEMDQNKINVFRADIGRARVLSSTGFFFEAYEQLNKIARKDVPQELLVEYFDTYTEFYHYVYSSTDEPEDFRELYKKRYSIYRDTLLTYTDKESQIYLRNMERIAAKTDEFNLAKNINEKRLDMANGPYERALVLYDRFAIENNYEKIQTPEALECLFKSAIIEVRSANQEIASLLYIETYLSSIGQIDKSQKVLDYYYTTMQKIGSRTRKLAGLDATMQIYNSHLNLLQSQKKKLQWAAILISLLLVALLLVLLKTLKSRKKITSLNEDLRLSGKISKRYVAEFFQLYSFYIKRQEAFRTKVHSNLKKGNTEALLEMTSPSNDIAGEELKEMYKNFDSAFIDIYPDFIKDVNKCLLDDKQITPKRTEILSTELRIQALVKLGVEDSQQISEMLHCSIKTIYNLRSTFKTRLKIKPEDFDRLLSEM